MAAVTALIATIDTNAGNKTATGTPAVGDIIAVVALASGTSEANAQTTGVSDDNVGGGNGYTKVVERLDGSSPVVSIWVRNSPIVSAASTIFTATQVNSSGGGLRVYTVSAMKRFGAGAVRQSGSASGAGGTTPAVTMPSAFLTGNAGLAAVVNSTNPPALTTISGWTAAAENGYATPTTGVHMDKRDSGETGTTLTWGSTTATAWDAVVVEFDASNVVPHISMARSAV